MGYVSSVCSGGQSCAVLADHNVMGFISAIHELASRERHLYCWCSSVRKILLTPLRKRGQRASTASFCLIKTFIKISVCVCVFSSAESLCPVLGEQCSHLFFSLCESFVQLSTLIGQHATALTYFLHNVQGCDVTTLPLLTHTEYFIDTYKRWVGFFCLTKQKSHHVIPSKKTWTDILMFMSVIPVMPFYPLFYIFFFQFLHSLVTVLVTLLVAGCLQNCHNYLRHRFNKMLEKYLRDFDPCCHDRITQLLLICQLHIHDALFIHALQSSYSAVARITLHASKPSWNSGSHILTLWSG